MSLSDINLTLIPDLFQLFYHDYCNDNWYKKRSKLLTDIEFHRL